MKTKLLVIVVVLLVLTQEASFAQTANEWNRRGVQYYKQGDYARSIECFLEALSIYERVLGKDHPYYATILNNLGNSYNSMGDYARAESYLLEALAIRERVLDKDHPDYATSLNNLGLLYKNMGDYARAEGYLLEALSIDERVLGKDHPDYATSLNNLGLLYDNMGDYGRAKDYYLEALSILERVLGKEHPYYATSLNNLGALYDNMGDYARAEGYYLEALSIDERVLGKDHPNYAASLNNLGMLYYSMGDYARAEGYYLEALSIRERVLGKEHPYYATSLNNLGALYDNIGDYGRAEGYHLEALSIRERVLGKDHPNYAISLNNLGLLYKNMGDYGRAEGYLLEALSIDERVLGKDHPSYAISLNNMGLLYSAMGDYGRAKDYYLEALSIRERVLGKDHPNYATSLNNLGGLYDSMGDYACAEKYYLEAHAILERVLGKDHPNYASSLNNLGGLYRAMGDYSHAVDYIQEASSIWERVLGKDHPDYATSLNNLGILYDNIGDYNQAEYYLQEAHAIVERVLDKEHPNYINSLDSLYGFYLTTGKYSQALVFKQEANQLNMGFVNRNFSFLSEQQRNLYWNANSSSFETSYSLSWFHTVPASNVLNYDNALFSKGLLLRTTNAVRDAIYLSGDQALIEQFETLGRLRQQISALQQSGGNEVYIQSLEIQAEALDKSLTQASVAYRELQEDLTLDWQNVRESLQQGEAAIEFVSFRIYDKGRMGKTQYAALVLRPGMEAPVWVPLCEETVLREIFEDLSGISLLIQARILYDEKGAALYNAVWQPLEELLEGVVTIYYSPSGLLHKVSFNAIPVKGNTNSRLMDRYNLNLVSSTREVASRKTALTPSSAVVYGGLLYDADAESMQQEALAYGTRSGTPDRGVEIGDYLEKTGGGTSWSYLRYTETESTKIHGLLTASEVSADLLNGVKGNKESFMDLNGKKTTVIHLATHGFFNQDIEKKNDDRERMQQPGGGQKAFENPLLRSGLILSGANTWAKNPVEGAGNGILLAADVARMNLLGAELVVLSACETALGEVNNSEGVFGLQRAFKLAGAETLIMSLWKVDDEATSILISGFYESWLSGKSKQEAFKEAQRKLRADTRYTAPFFWAAFIMMD